ncbi:MAG: hypothetical protein SH868_05585 [Bythopirellula sp.]|nr:hypothetical protein [Bythopirellula sp.]
MKAPLPHLENWTPDQAARMENAIFVAQHRLQDLEMFRDEHLIDTLDRHPRQDLGINTMGTDPRLHHEWQEGRAGELTAEQLFEAVSRGKIWLNLRRVMDHHAEYADVVNRLYAELEATCPGLQTYNRSANLLISSPRAIVYYHLDCPVNMLWHIRGQKRVWAYPLEAGIVSDETIEGVLCGEKSEELEFQPEWDDLAVVYDLEPGEMVTWPQHTPHRVVNTHGVNVSLSTEHMTSRAARRNNVFLANRHFRQVFGGEFRSTELTGWAPALKEFALRAMRRVPKLAPAAPTGYKYPVTFEVDLDAPNCVRQLKECRELKLALM